MRKSGQIGLALIALTACAGTEETAQSKGSIISGVDVVTAEASGYDKGKDQKEESANRPAWKRTGRNPRMTM